MVDENFFHGSQRAFELFRSWSYREGNNKTWLAIFLKWMVIVLSGIVLVLISVTEAIEQTQHGQIEQAFCKGLFMLAVGVSVHKMYSAAFGDDEIQACIKKMEIMSRKFKNKSEIERSLNVYNKLFFAGMCSMGTATVFFMLAPLMEIERRSLAFKPYLSFLDLEKVSIWLSVYVYEAIVIVPLTVITIAYDTLFCGMMCLCTGILSSICQEIQELENIIDDHQTSDNKMKDTIDKINEITQLITNISDTFSMTTMSHIVNTCNCIAVGLFMASILPFGDISFVSMVTIIVLVTFQLWIYCYFGQTIVSQREVLRRELCFIRWYDASQNFKTMLLLTIFESQKDRYVYAGKVVPLSLEIFAEVIKKAYAFLTFLNKSRR